MTDTDEINIPESALAVKPWFPDRPSDDIVREIKKFIAEGGRQIVTVPT